MRAPVSLGFLAPEDKRLRAGSWFISASGDVLTDPGAIADWDYFTPMTISLQLEADLTGALEDSRLSTDAELAGVITWHSSWTNLRGASKPHRIVDGMNSLVLELPPEQLGGRLTLECRVVLSRLGSKRDSLAPYRPGSTLWSDEIRVTLEGEGARFPVLPIDFPQAGIGGGLEKAAWALTFETRDLSASGAGSVKLLLNTAHPSVRTLLDNPGALESKALQEFLRYDTARQLFVVALTDEELADGIPYEEGTLGELLATFIRRMFPSRRLESLRGDWNIAPGELEAELQARLRFLEHP